MDLQLSRPGRFSFAPHRRTQDSGELFFEHGNITYSPIISAAWTLARNVSGGHNVNLVAQMIESEQPVKEHQFAIRQGQVIFCTLTDVFQLPYYIVRKIAYRSCSEGRQPGNYGWPMLTQQELYEFKDAALVPFAVP